MIKTTINNPEPERCENAVLAVALALAVVLSVGMILLMLLGVVRAEDRTRTLYNERGQEVGRATTRGNTTTFSNERGQSVGRAESVQTARRTSTTARGGWLDHRRIGGDGA
jgi:hypothetical protein